MNHLGVDLQRTRARNLLAGQPGHGRALLEALDVVIEDPSDPDDHDMDEIADAVERMLRPRADTCERLLGNGHPALAELRVMTASAPIASRLIGIGVDPVALAATGLLGLGSVTVDGGDLAGATLECESVRRREGYVTAGFGIVTDHVVWDAWEDDLTLMRHALPQSACVAAAGMALDDLVDTVLTRGLGLRVREAVCDERGPSTTVRLEPQELARFADVPRMIADATRR